MSSQQLSALQAPQTHQEESHVSPAPLATHHDTAFVLKHQHEPTTSPRQDSLLRAGGHPRSTGSSYQRLNALLWLFIHPHHLGPRRGDLGVFLGAEMQT